MLISYCVVNTNGRDLLMRSLDAIERTHPPELDREVLVLDNASDDGSAEAVRERGGDVHLIALDRAHVLTQVDANRLFRRALEHLAEAGVGVDDDPALVDDHGMRGCLGEHVEPLDVPVGT